MFNTRWQCSRQTNSVGLRHLQFSDATNKLARVHQFTAVLSGSDHLGFWCWLMERGGERERGGGSASKSSSREKLEYIVCHVFSFVPTFGRQASQWKVVDLVRFLRFMSMRLQPNAHSPKNQTQVSIFCFFDAITCSCRCSLNKHKDLMEAYTVVSSNLLNIIELEWKIYRKPLYLMVNTCKNLKTMVSCRFALFAKPLKIWVA